MGRAPCCEKDSVKRGPWTPEEDAKLLACVAQHGTGSWRTLPKKAGLQRCGKSCRLRWTNYLRPDLKHGRFTDHEEQTIVKLHAALGSRWSLIAAQLPGRTDNDVKNYWNTRLKKKLCEMGIDPITHKPISQLLADLAGSMGAMTPAQCGQSIAAAGRMATPGRTIADAALGCFKDDMLNVIMRRHPSNSVVSGAMSSSSLSASASCTSSPTTTSNGAPERPNMQPTSLSTSQVLQMNSAFCKQLPFSLLPGVGSSLWGGNVTAGGNPATAQTILPPCLRFLNPTTPPSPFSSFASSRYSPLLASASQQPAKSMMGMLLDSNTNHTIASSSSSSPILGEMPSYFTKGINEGTSNVQIQLSKSTSLQVEQNYSLSMQSAISSDTDKFLASQADLQAHIVEPNPWFSTQQEDKEEEEEERHPQDTRDKLGLFHESSLSNMYNWAHEASLHTHAKSLRGDTNNMLAWSPTCTSRSSSTSSNFHGPSDTTHTLPQSITDQAPLTSVDAMLWDLSDLHAFIS